MLKTERMTKVSITGPKSQLGTTIRELHRLGVLDIEDYDGQYDEFEVGSPESQSDDISRVLVKLRSLKSKLPEVEDVEDTGIQIHGLDELEENLEELDDTVQDYLDEIGSLEDRRDEQEQLLRYLKLLDRMGVRLDDIDDYDSLTIYFGTVDDVSFEDELPEGRYELNRVDDSILLFVDADLDVENDLSRSGYEPYDITPLLGLDGLVDEEMREAGSLLEEVESDIKDTRRKLRGLAEENLEYLRVNEKELVEELEKAEAPLKFATSENAFIAEGWVPREAFDGVREELEEGTGDRVHVSTETPDEGQKPPVQHDNPRPFDNFDPLTDLVSVPKYDEIDPTFLLAVTFPIFFGFMIGDAGYGLTSGIVFYLAMRMFPSASKIFKSLLFASFWTLVFGLAFGDAFGYIIFGESSVLASLTGVELFRNIPILFHRAHHLGTVFTAAALIGVFHVNLGYLLGMWNEYKHHGMMEAILAKGSWIMLEIGALLFILQGATVGGAVLALAVVMLYMGEGIEGVVEIPSLISNILSYLRIFGVAVAAISLAKVVNGLADPLFQMGTAWGLVGGVAVLMIGHTFNTFIKIMEGFLQGIRLHYVELFTKFYEGGGKRYTPFGGKDNI